MAVVVGVAVLREGAEVVLFLYGIAVSGDDTLLSMAAGGALGLLLGGVLTVLMYFGLLRIPPRYLFSVTSWFIALLAAGMAAQAVGFLQMAGIATTFSQPLWNTADVLPDSSLVGMVLRTLIGYTDQPTGTLIGYTDQPTGLQLAAYVLSLATILTLMRLFGSASRKQALA